MLDETCAQQDEKLLMEYKAILHTQIEKLMPGLDDVVRRIMEGLKKDIQNYHVVSEIPGGLISLWNPCYDVLEVGYQVSAARTEFERVELVEVIAIAEDRTSATVQFKNGDTLIKDVKYLYSPNHGKTTMAKEILKHAKHFGFRKVKHTAEKQAIIGTYAMRFANYYEEKLYNRKTELLHALESFFSAIFDVVPDIPEEIVTKMKTSFDLKLHSCSMAADNQIARLAQHNRPPIGHTMNEEYFKNLVIEMLQVDKGANVSNGTVTLIYCEILALVKIQKKIVAVWSAKELEATLTVGAIDAYKQVIKAVLSPMHLISPGVSVSDEATEPDTIVADRQPLLMKRHILGAALAQTAETRLNESYAQTEEEQMAKKRS